MVSLVKILFRQWYDYFFHISIPFKSLYYFFFHWKKKVSNNKNSFFSLDKQCFKKGVTT